MGPNLFINYGEAVAMILFGIGFGNLLLQSNLIKKIIGLNIMDTAIYLFLAEKGYINGRVAPIINRRRSKHASLHQSHSQRPGTDRHRGICICFRPYAGAYHQAVQALSHTGSG